MMTATDITGLPFFIAVAEAKSFRLAAERMGVTRSAVSQAVRRLEDRLGVALVHRTTRSVTLTEAGSNLYDRLAPALGEVDQALDAARGGLAPSGVLRLAVSSIAESLLDGRLFAGFIDAYPEITLDVTVTDEEFDILQRGFDAGVRLGETLELDMVAVPVSGDQRQLIVATPAYLAERGTPAHPSDLVHHRCIGWRPAPDLAPYRWEFTVDGRDVAVAVNPALTTSDMGVMLRTALADGGITCGMAETFMPYLNDGRLVTVLEEHCPPFPGFYLYYPSRRTAAPKLKAFIAHVQRWRATSS